MNSSDELSWFAAHLQTAVLPATEPSTDLWARIAEVHAQQVRKRKHWRYAGGTLTASLVLALAVSGWLFQPGVMHQEENVDWQARAQALELQLAALDHTRNDSAEFDTGDVEAELGEIDRRLQTAYEPNGAGSLKYTNELVPLWRRRSELLNALILTRQQGLALTRI